MKPKIRPLTHADAYFSFRCTGFRGDVLAWGWGHTIEQAYQRWLDYDENDNDIPF